jgi:hypothetical protein
MKFLQTDQIISAVIGWPQHHRIGWLRQKIYRLGEGLLRNRGAVRINQTEGIKPNPQEIFGGERQSFAKRFATLRHQLEFLGQDPRVSCACFHGRIHGDAAGFSLLGGFRDRCGRVSQKTGVQRRCFLG